jgi:UDP-glucose 4-epimerase
MYALRRKSCKAIDLCSSTAVYGSTTEPATEATEPRPDSFYSISKHRAEQHVQRLFNKTNTIIIRLGNVYGYSKVHAF